MEKHYLMTPGPTPIPEEIIKTMARPIIHHRTPQYLDIVKKVNEDLKKVFKTSCNVLTFTASGTGAREASVVNTLCQGDTAVVVRGGKFGERFAEICQAYGVKVVPVDIDWGTRPEPSVIEGALKRYPETKAVFMQLCETSTATVYDVKSIAGLMRERETILVVDAISGLGADEFEMDSWGVDVACGGSQKSLMLPPGLAFCAVSKKAWTMVRRSKLPKFYLDFEKYDQLVDKGDSPWTPSITLVIGLQRALSMITQEGVDNFIKRHKADAEFVRSFLKGLGLGIYSKFPSDAVTAAKVPHGVDGQELICSLKAKGVTF